MSAVVNPTLIFYVLELGGNKNQYGMMLSAQFLAMFLMTTVYGKWIDSNGNKFTMPYVASFALGIASYSIYFIAIILPIGPIAIYTLMFSRFLEGMSVAGRTLSYSWLHAAVPHDKQKTIMTLLSMAKTMGTIVGPLTNLLVSEIHTEFHLFGVTIPVNPYNSVGILMVVSEIILLILVLIFLVEPPEKEEDDELKKDKKEEEEEKNDTNESKKGVLFGLTHFDIWFPIFSMFCMIVNYSIFITAFAPVGKHAMQWDAVQISNLSAIQSIVTFAGMTIAMGLSMKNVPDRWMINFGFTCFVFAGLAMYVYWIDGATYWGFAGPSFLLGFIYPFIGPSCRSMYAKGIRKTPGLEGIEGIMMSLISQAIAFAGMVAPVTAAFFVLRSPEEVDADPLNKHELRLGALYVPLLSVSVIIGLAYQYYFYEKPHQEEKDREEEATADNSDSDDTTTTASESSQLLSQQGGKKRKKNARNRRASTLEISDAFSRVSEVSRRISCEVAGVPNPFDTKDEKEYYDKLWKDKQEWEKLKKIHDNDDGIDAEK